VVADFALQRIDEFRSWHKNSQYIVSLQVPSPEALEELYSRAFDDGHDVISFREPDLGDQLTAIAFVPHEHVKPFLANLPLAGKHFRAAKNN